MKVSVEMARKVTEIKNQIGVLNQEGKVEEAHTMLAELREVQNKLEIQTVLEEEDVTLQGKETKTTVTNMNQTVN